MSASCSQRTVPGTTRGAARMQACSAVPWAMRPTRGGPCAGVRARRRPLAKLKEGVAAFLWHHLLAAIGPPGKSPKGGRERERKRGPCHDRACRGCRRPQPPLYRATRPQQGRACPTLNEEKKTNRGAKPAPLHWFEPSSEPTGSLGPILNRRPQPTPRQHPVGVQPAGEGRSSCWQPAMVAGCSKKKRKKRKKKKKKERKGGRKEGASGLAGVATTAGGQPRNWGKADGGLTKRGHKLRQAK